MKIGLSIYSLYQAIRGGEITPVEAMDLIAGYGAQSVELVGFVIGYGQDRGIVEGLKERAVAHNLEIAAYSIFSDVLDKRGVGYDAEIARIHSQIDLADELGARVMRTDFTQWGRPREDNTPARFDRDMPRLVDICREISAYAERYGITMTVENHGTYINNSERVARLILAVDRPNFRCTLDVGNCLCVDEDPLVCVTNLLPYAATVHFKDFYIRRDPTGCGAGGPAKFAVGAWLTTNYGRFIRGSIVGDGDVDAAGLMKIIRDYGYDGCVSVEFEGMEDCRLGSRVSLANVMRYLTL